MGSLEYPAPKDPLIHLYDNGFFIFICKFLNIYLISVAITTIAPIQKHNTIKGDISIDDSRILIIIHPTAIGLGW